MKATLPRINPDNVYTPDVVARDMVAHFNPRGSILEPCSGKGAFLNFLGERAEACEIEDGADFFDCQKRFDWIIGNPPYSIFNRWLEHSFSLTENVCYLIYLGKIFASTRSQRLIREYGGIKEIRYYGSGNRLGFPFGFLCAAVHFQKTYTGAIIQSYFDDLRDSLPSYRPCANTRCQNEVPYNRRSFCSQRCKNVQHQRLHRARLLAAPGTVTIAA